jgi:signal transduction histidine kinase
MGYSMSIRTKTLLIVGLTLLSLIAVLYASSHAILLQSYLKLEEEGLIRNVQRAHSPVQDEIAFLQRTSIDYAHWDDTYNYIRGLDPGYIEANVFNTVLLNYRLDFMMFVDADGEVVYSLGLDLETNEPLPIPEDLLALVSHNEAYIRPKDADGNLLKDGYSGIVALPDTSVMLAVAPILPTDLSGEPGGALIWGRYIDDAVVSSWAEQTQLTIEVGRVTEAANDEDFAQVLPVLLTTPITVQTRGEDTIDGYTLLRDIDNQPALILEVIMPRSVYQQGLNALSYFLFSLVLLGVMSAAVIALLLERGVLSRLASMNKQVNRIQQEGDMTLRVAMGGTDELSVLATNVNAMIESLQAQEKIKQARDNALEAARLKAEILANVSHDARTPLAVIMLRTEMLLRGVYGTLTPKQQETLSTMNMHAQQLLYFVNNLLEGAQLETGRLQIKVGETDPAKLLETMRTTLSPLAGLKNVRLEVELDEEMPAVVYADPRRLEQILSNLVGNAIKFTDTGSVTTRMYRVDDEHWALEVKDTGKGIAPEHQAHIFDAFWQVDGSTTRAASSGVGLGLMIVKQLTELMGGTISITSTVGVGSTFTVILPIQVARNGVELAHAT